MRGAILFLLFVLAYGFAWATRPPPEPSKPLFSVESREAIRLEDMDTPELVARIRELEGRIEELEKRK
jgi:hypothetical protein